MLRQFSVNYVVLSLTVDILSTVLAFSLAICLHANLKGLTIATPLEIPSPFFIIVAALWVVTFLVASVYAPRRAYAVVDEYRHVIVGVSIAALIFAGLWHVFLPAFSALLFLLFVSINLTLLLTWRSAARILRRLVRLQVTERRVLIVGAGEVGRRVGDTMLEHHWIGLELTGYLDGALGTNRHELHALGGVKDVRQVTSTQNIHDVIIALPQSSSGQINELVEALHDLPVNLRVVPGNFSLGWYRMTADDLGELLIINLAEPTLDDAQRLTKRLFDLLVAGISLLFMGPIFGALALLIKLDSRGPVIFRQKRVGENGRIFDMYKFRSMVVGAEDLQSEVNQVNGIGQIIHKKIDDPRVTRAGAFLRRTSLDELPQLFNVWKGDMSLVGPRPEMPWLVEQYEPWQHTRFAVPQGITGWWQVHDRSDKPMHLHTEDDLYYIHNYSLWMDIYILLKTPLAVVRGRGAY